MTQPQSSAEVPVAGFRRSGRSGGLRRSWL